MTARPAPTGALHARTVPLEYGPDALEFDGSPTVLFDRPGLTLVGWGTALLVPATQAAAALAAIPCDDTVDTLGSGPVALGALPFDDTFAGHLVVPRVTLGTTRDLDGVTRRWATAIGPADVALPSTHELFDAVIWQYGSTSQPDVPHDAEVVELTTAMTASGYAAMVGDAVAVMARPDATLRKVVLSRPVEVRLRGRLGLSAVLRRLREGEPNCTIFSMPVPRGSFVGASPELLVERRGDRFRSRPLAGTTDRVHGADSTLPAALLDSTKDAEEHRLVVDAIHDALAPLSDELHVPENPELVHLHNITHLGTTIEGTLRSGDDGGLPSVLQLVALLHPTPAVGGVPREAALDLIGRLEDGSRGHYAGPVGWIDGTGDGRFVVGIRAMTVTGDSVALTAGVGIVSGSRPEVELRETGLKFSAVFDALAPGVTFATFTVPGAAGPAVDG